MPISIKAIFPKQYSDIKFKFWHHTIFVSRYYSRCWNSAIINQIINNNILFKIPYILQQYILWHLFKSVLDFYPKKERLFLVHIVTLCPVYRRNYTCICIHNVRTQHDERECVDMCSKHTHKHIYTRTCILRDFIQYHTSD